MSEIDPARAGLQGMTDETRKTPMAKVILMTGSVSDQTAGPDRVFVVLDAALADVRSGAIGVYREVELRSPTDAHGTSPADLHALMLRLDEVARRDEVEYETHGDEHRAAFCDGGATRIKWVIEELRKLAGFPCEWKDSMP